MTSHSQPQAILPPPPPILPPVTPVRVPKAATVYTPSTQDPDLRTQINTLLLREGHVEKISQTLHHALHAHASNWPSAVSTHAFALLRSGECTTFPKLMERVMADIRRDTAAEAAAAAAAVRKSGGGLKKEVDSAPSGAPGAPGKGKATAGEAKKGEGIVNGVSVNGVGAAAGDGKAGATATMMKIGLAVPQSVIEEGIRITRECLEQVCEVDD